MSPGSATRHSLPRDDHRRAVSALRRPERLAGVEPDPHAVAAIALERDRAAHRRDRARERGGQLVVRRAGLAAAVLGERVAHDAEARAGARRPPPRRRRRSVAAPASPATITQTTEDSMARRSSRLPRRVSPPRVTAGSAFTEWDDARRAPRAMLTDADAPFTGEERAAMMEAMTFAIRARRGSTSSSPPWSARSARCSCTTTPAHRPGRLRPGSEATAAMHFDGPPPSSVGDPAVPARHRARGVAARGAARRVRRGAGRAAGQRAAAGQRVPALRRRR